MQVSGLPEQRDREMHEAGLRIPPSFARDASNAEALLLGKSYLNTLIYLSVVFSMLDMHSMLVADLLEDFKQAETVAMANDDKKSPSWKLGSKHSEHSIIFMARKILPLVS